MLTRPLRTKMIRAEYVCKAIAAFADSPTAIEMHLSTRFSRLKIDILKRADESYFLTASVTATPAIVDAVSVRIGVSSPLEGKPALAKRCGATVGRRVDDLDGLKELVHDLLVTDVGLCPIDPVWVKLSRRK